MFGVIIGNGEVDSPPRDYRTANSYSDDELSSAICRGLRKRGVMPDPDYAEPWFLCYALSEADVDETLQAYEDVVESLI
jgi:glutamate-1-semialdehyde aminotransferase